MSTNDSAPSASPSASVSPAASSSSSTSSSALAPAPAAAAPSISAPSAAPSAHTDVWPFRLTILALGSATLVPVAGAIALAIQGKTVPEILVSIASVAAGALAGFIMPTPPRSASSSSEEVKDATR